mmetsp:Transcript_27974/g.61391  ORF Transcript_27974/g.61391 Transcript_27974/m.61391 type:complete len:86 (+) Transcript_27974:401-658(+)
MQVKLPPRVSPPQLPTALEDQAQPLHMQVTLAEPPARAPVSAQAPSNAADHGTSTQELIVPRGTPQDRYQAMLQQSHGRRVNGMW